MIPATSEPNVRGGTMYDDPATIHSCTSCGTERQDGALFCGRCGHAFDGAPASDPAAAPAPLSADSAAVAAVPRGSIAANGVVVVLGALLAGVGAALPWISATVVLIGTVSFSGLDGGGDGILVLFLAVVAVFGGVGLLQGGSIVGPSRALSILLGITLVVLAGIEIANVNDRVAEAGSFAVASVGIGLYVVILGGCLTVLGGVMPPKE